jgi:hypothetical protein
VSAALFLAAVLAVIPAVVATGTAVPAAVPLRNVRVGPEPADETHETRGSTMKYMLLLYYEPGTDPPSPPITHRSECRSEPEGREQL